MGEQSNSEQKLLGISKAVQNAYKAAGDTAVSNRRLYDVVASQLELDLGLFTEPTVGKEFSVPARSVRWVQQTLKARGLLESSGQRGSWRLTPKGKLRLHHADRGEVLVAFHTRLGIALLADCRAGFVGLDEPVHLVVTSPPYALARKWGRAYGGPAREEYIDFICAALEGVVRTLAPGGSIALNLSNDIFETGLPSRSLYLEHLTIALNERLGLSLMDRLVWSNAAKPPGPTEWALRRRQQLCCGYEPVLWLCNDPLRTFADNRRVLQPHTERHLRLIARGGERSGGVYADGAHTRKPGAFGAATEGSIPRNVLSFGHNCSSQKAYKAAARAAGLPAHGAPFPYRLAEFLIRFLSEEDHLVVDPFGGSMTTGLAAERNGRRWISTEAVAEYARGGALRFGEEDELWVNPDLDLALARRGVGQPLGRAGPIRCSS